MLSTVFKERSMHIDKRLFQVTYTVVYLKNCACLSAYRTGRQIQVFDVYIE